MKKILFIVPMHITFESYIKPGANSRAFPKKDGKFYNSLSTDLPLGVLSLSAYLKKNIEVYVELLDFNAEINALEYFQYDSYKKVVKDLLAHVKSSPDIIGISSLFSPSYQNFLDTAVVARSMWPNSIILGGGNIPTNSYKDIYQDQRGKNFDALCYGEGEKALLELLKAENPHDYIAQSSSWISLQKINADELFVPKHNFIENLDEIPFLDYQLCDLTKHAVNQNLSSFHSVKNPKGFHIMTSRGCPYLCTFCASHKTHGRSMRYYSLERVEEDIAELAEKYGADTVVFQDDHLMADPERVYKILKIVKKYKLNSLYQNGLTLYALDRKMLEAFYDAGVRHLVLPVESGSEKVLKYQMRKPLKNRISERVAKDCRELGIYTNINIIVGMPGETKDDLEESRINLRKMHGNWFNIACASPLVGSEMHDLAQQKKYINIDAIGSDYHVATINTEDFTSREIQEFQYKLNIELNFIYNNDLRYGEFELALLGFKNVIKLRGDHALAHFFAGLCLFKLNNDEFTDRISKYLEYCNDAYWNKFVKEYKLPEKYEEICSYYKNYESEFSKNLIY